MEENLNTPENQKKGGFGTFMLVAVGIIVLLILIKYLIDKV
jgi:hypothetical protein